MLLPSSISMLYSPKPLSSSPDKSSVGSVSVNSAFVRVSSVVSPFSSSSGRGSIEFFVVRCSSSFSSSSEISSATSSSAAFSNKLSSIPTSVEVCSDSISFSDNSTSSAYAVISIFVNNIAAVRIIQTVFLIFHDNFFLFIIIQFLSAVFCTFLIYLFTSNITFSCLLSSTLTLSKAQTLLAKTKEIRHFKL